MVWSQIAAMAPGVVGGIIAGQKRTGAGKDAERVLDQAADEWRAINMPDLSPIEFERYKDLFMPQIQADTGLSDIELDPALREAQMAALGQLGEISQGGLTLQDKADLAEIQGEVARQDAARQGAIMQGMAERGMGGAGMELAQRLQSQQGGADRAAADARNVAATAQARAMQAIMDRGQLGGQMRAQEYGMASDAARAQDAINAFNAAQRQEGQRVRQDVGMRNVDVTNVQRQQANTIAQQNYENMIRRQQGISGLAVPRAGVTERKGAAEADIYSQLGKTGSKGIGSYDSGDGTGGTGGTGGTA